jgi:hypothetical protein
MNIKCPCCGSQFSLEVALQDEAGRELITEIAKLSPALCRALFAYLALFRPLNKALSWGRTLKLAKDVIGLAPEYLLQPALEDTLTSLQDKRGQPGWKPMKNHNYLKRVLESVEGSHLVAAPLERIHTAPNQSTRKRSLRDDLTDKSWAE